jgi:spermidine synthase
MLLILSAFVLAFCGVVYELALAQTNSVLLGNSYLQYGLTIGLFMAGLGAGSLREGRGLEPRAQLIRLQTWLAAGAPAGYLLLWSAALVLPPAALWLPSCALIFAIGFINGRELPLLMRLSGDGANLALAADYFGMLAAAALFPYFLLPQLGTLGALACAALLNALSIQLLQPVRAWRFSPLVAALVALIYFQEFIWQWFSRQYTSGLL